MRGIVFVVIVAAGFSFALPEAPQAQQRNCELEIQQTPGQRSHLETLPDGGTRIDVGGGVVATCGTSWVRADSATYYGERGLLYLIGNVEYTDEDRKLGAERATYYENEGWVRCEGNVRLTDAGGRSTLSGPVLDYFPARDTSTVERIYAPDRPHLTYYTDTPGAAASPPFDVDADRMHIYGDSAVAAAGEVVAVRGELIANSDSMDLDLGRDELWLLGDPNVTASAMVLEGDSILVLMDASQINEIQAWPNGIALGREMELRAPFLRFFVAGEEIERAVASAGDPLRTGAIDRSEDTPWAESRSQDYLVVADSLEIRRPGGRLDRVVAIERAEARSLTPVDPSDLVLGYDWMVGDTITGFFTAPDSFAANGQEVQLSHLVASGNARALYHMLDQNPEGASAQCSDRPAVNYVIGRAITLWLESGEVQDALVVGPATGLYNEVLPCDVVSDSAAMADSLLRIEADTARTARDTIDVSLRGTAR
jgi:lipopolysaccharide export system protein LptA